MACRAMQALYLLALDPISETTADLNSYGFRPGRSTADAIEACFKVLSKRTAPQWVLEGDIKGCFDAISHTWLETHIPMEKALLKKWLKAGYMEQHVLHPTEEGTPQGGIISPVLANMALDGLEKLLRERYPKPHTGDNAKVNCIRYADDFLITGDSKALLEKEVKPLVEQFMSERGLSLSQEKTVITHIEEGFDFLGQQVRKYKSGSVLTTPAKKNVKAFLKKVRGMIEQYRDSSAGQLIVKLNPVIRGWATYHRFGSSSQTFNSVDSAIFKKLWWWARRRHPRKSATWVKQKYFTTVGTMNWVFTGEVEDEEGHKKLVHLRRASDVKIQRHTPIQGEANPFDPAWEVYFEKRLGVKMARNLTGRRQLRHLWEEQNGICPMCQQKITQITGWHNHHIIWKSKGGTHHAANRVLLHPTCHRQLHSQGLN